jgi:hypothetical protein
MFILLVSQQRGASLLIPQPHNYPSLRSIEAIGLNEQFSGVNDRKRMWRMGQEALKEASLTDDSRARRVCGRAALGNYTAREESTMTNKFLLTICALLVSLPAFAQEWTTWTKEERTAGLKTFEFTRHVPAGKQRILDGFVFLNPDCTLGEGAETIITKPPEYGSAVIETRESFPTFAKDNMRSKCNEKKMRMPMLIYKAAAGHAETDMFEVTTIGPNGMATLMRYTIKIVDTASKKKERAP